MGRLKFRRDAPNKLMKCRLFLPYAPFNKATLFGSQMCCQDLLISRDVRSVSLLRSFHSH